MLALGPISLLADNAALHPHSISLLILRGHALFVFGSLPMLSGIHS